jgi:transcriptional regulator with XRE-family HTH domain
MLIQKLRLQRGWSQQQLADLSGLSVRTIQRLEQGQSASVESLKSLAAVFEIDFSQLQRTDMPTADTPNEVTTAPSQHSLSADEVLALHHVRKLKSFYMHLAQYVIFITLLLGINLWTRPQYLWVGWVAMGWGIGLLFHGLRVFERFSPFGVDWEKKQVEKRLGRKI